MRSNQQEGCNFDPDRYVQAKGALVDWQCKPCNIIERDVDLLPHQFPFNIDLIEGNAEKVPVCKKCGRNMRPNVHFRSDLGWMEDDTGD